MPSLRVAGWYPALVQVWTPLAWNARERAVRSERLQYVIARLKPGVDRLQAQAEMDTLAGRLAQQYPEADKGSRATAWRGASGGLTASHRSHFSTGDNVWASRARSQRLSGCSRYIETRYPASCVVSPPASGVTDSASRLRV